MYIKNFSKELSWGSKILDKLQTLVKVENQNHPLTNIPWFILRFIAPTIGSFANFRWIFPNFHISFHVPSGPTIDFTCEHRRRWARSCSACGWAWFGGRRLQTPSIWLILEYITKLLHIYKYMLNSYTENFLVSLKFLISMEPGDRKLKSL